jgi:predicted nucleic acid-binding protein
LRFLLDTNVVSALRRRRCDPAVAKWFESVRTQEHYISALVVGEIRRGITKLERRDADQARVYDAWLAELVGTFADRILSIDTAVADRWGRIEISGPFPVQDGMMAATALVHDLTFVTRNVKDVAQTGARLLNPWEYR